MDVFKVTLACKDNGVWLRHYTSRTVTAEDARSAIDKVLRLEKRYGGEYRAETVTNLATLSR